MSEDKNFFDWRNESKEKKYQFIKEQIRPQKKRTLIQYLKKICVVVSFALMFGIVSGTAFVAMQNFVWEEENTDFQEIMAADTTSAEIPLEGSKAEAVTDEEFNKAINSLNAYQSFCENVALVGGRCNQYIVGVKVESGNNLPDDGVGDGMKSGVIFKETSQCYYVLTHSDEIAEEQNVRVKLLESFEVDAQFLGADYALGIAVLKVKKEGIPEKIGKQILVAEFGSDLNLKLNTPIIVVGNANGVFGSVELGNVIKEGIAQEIVDGDVTLYASNIRYYEEGNGFVTDIKGRIVGIITTSFLETTGEANCAFIGIEKILPGITRLLEKREITYFGIRGVDLDEGVAKELETEGGLYVSDVISGSPAYKAKIRVGDVIVRMDDKKIYSFQELRGCLVNASSGDEVTVYVKRSSGDGYVERKMRVVLE